MLALAHAWRTRQADLSKPRDVECGRMQACPTRPWLREETLDEAVWGGAQPAVHIVVAQHAEAASRHALPRQLAVPARTTAPI